MTDLVVIMSVYSNDKLKFIKESVQSILDQTFTQFHYYIIFDGPLSQDINNYITSLKDNRIKIFRLEKNSGLANALNYLLKIILNNPEYEFIARMDADDISMPTRFERQREFLCFNTDISCVGSWYQEVDESNRHISDLRLPVKHEDLKKLYCRRTPFAHSSVMFRRNMIETAGFYPTDTILMEDNVLWGRALKAGLRFANIPQYLLKFRVDKEFFKRRSGLKYGWKYITTRSKLIRELKIPCYYYLFSFAIGCIKMTSPLIIKYAYKVFRTKKIFSNSSLLKD